VEHDGARPRRRSAAPQLSDRGLGGLAVGRPRVGVACSPLAGLAGWGRGLLRRTPVSLPGPERPPASVARRGEARRIGASEPQGRGELIVGPRPDRSGALELVGELERSSSGRLDRIARDDPARDHPGLGARP
jgi:hypothetical protein